MSKAPRALRLPPELEAQAEALARSRGHTFSTVMRDALREHLDRERQLDEMAALERRLVGSMTRVMKDVRIVRNDVHLTMAFINTLAESYLLHTPPLPDEAVDVAAASATDRYRKFLKRVVSNLQGGEGLWSELQNELDVDAGTEA
ncbi:hypothetical protein QLQ15_11105 [Lysobacter sp. LF1]|uniref:Ribbon-helix-helix protein, CopG family n=1 Tax=Lysobacter stagni TaxID=3045172 RepID=A0ABT6XH18_9GAMM|nr:hypothetical protein [Lysobacter sp. LF1]MDI9239451.1 hypothetical protein [Lysobacter sp. LF1]